jgi:hypothetical protein
VTAWLVLPAMLGLGVTSAYQLFRCRYDGMARRSCCCPMESPAGADAAPEPIDARVFGTDCCVIEIVHVSQPPAMAQQEASQAHAAPPLAIGGARAPWVAPALRTQPVAHEVPRAVGPPLLLAKQSLLI